jgi:hypothetical protein
MYISWTYISLVLALLLEGSEGLFTRENAECSGKYKEKQNTPRGTSWRRVRDEETGVGGKLSCGCRPVSAAWSQVPLRGRELVFIPPSIADRPLHPTPYQPFSNPCWWIFSDVSFHYKTSMRFWIVRELYTSISCILDAASIFKLHFLHITQWMSGTGCCLEKSVSVPKKGREFCVRHWKQTSCGGHTLYYKQVGVWCPFASISGLNVIFSYLVVVYYPSERQNNFSFRKRHNLTCRITRAMSLTKAAIQYVSAYI